MAWILENLLSVTFSFTQINLTKPVILTNSASFQIYIKWSNVINALKKKMCAAILANSLRNPRTHRDINKKTALKISEKFIFNVPDALDFGKLAVCSI